VIGKELGDVARVALPGGAREFEILEIFVDYQEEASEPRAE
jgi:transcription elongation GreA/GreB family factor